MTRFGIVLWLVLAVGSGFATFTVKYAVQDIEDQLNRVRKQTIAEQQEIRVLTAEWTYLNQPERLAELNRRFLSLVPISTKQLQHSIDAIALRAPPSEMLMAAAMPAPRGLPQAAPPVAVAAARSAANTGSSIAAVAGAAPGAPAPRPIPVAARPPQAIRFAKAVAPPNLSSLDALVAQIAETR